MPEQQAHAPFRRAVLGLNGGPTDARIVHLGCQLARGSGAELIAVHVVEVDWRHDLSEDIASDNEQATAILDMAEGIAERYKIRLQADLLQARDVGAAIVDESIELDADAIILGLPFRHHFGGDFAIGTTVPYIFQNAPCQVIVVRESVPAGGERQSTEAPAVPAARTR
jgi:nucleotide-binding universal stress UspA family protein